MSSFLAAGILYHVHDISLRTVSAHPSLAYHHVSPYEGQSQCHNCRRGYDVVLMAEHGANPALGLELSEDAVSAYQ